MKKNSLKNISNVFNFTESGKILGNGKIENLVNLILPGQSVSINFRAINNQYLTFITMYGASRDWFFSPDNPGIKLFDDQGKAFVGDISSQIKLWDNGTSNDITGETEFIVISEVRGIKASDLMKLNLTYDEKKTIFTLTITNISDSTPNITGFSPGVWAVSNYNANTEELLNENPFFTVGKLSSEEITDIAQMGNITKLYEKVTKNTNPYKK